MQNFSTIIGKIDQSSEASGHRGTSPSSSEPGVRSGITPATNLYPAVSDALVPTAEEPLPKRTRRPHRYLEANEKPSSLNTNQALKRLQVQVANIAQTLKELLSPDPTSLIATETPRNAGRISTSEKSIESKPYSGVQAGNAAREVTRLINEFKEQQARELRLFMQRLERQFVPQIDTELNAGTTRQQGKIESQIQFNLARPSSEYDEELTRSMSLSKKDRKNELRGNANKVPEDLVKLIWGNTTNIGGKNNMESKRDRKKREPKENEKEKKENQREKG